MDRFILYQHLLHYLLTSSLLLCLHTLLNYFGFPVKLQPEIWICMSTYCSFIWTAFHAHQTRLYLCFLHLGWPASRALRSPHLFSGLIMLALCTWQIKHQKMMNHSFLLDCQKSKELVELCTQSTQQLPSLFTGSRCQKLKPASHKKICQKLSEHLLDKSLLPYGQDLSIPSNHTISISRTRLNLKYKEDGYTITILKLFMRLIILRCLIYCIIHVPIPQVMSVLTIGFSICTELILSFV